LGKVERKKKRDGGQKRSNMLRVMVYENKGGEGGKSLTGHAKIPIILGRCNRAARNRRSKLQRKLRREEEGRPGRRPSGIVLRKRGEGL